MQKKSRTLNLSQRLLRTFLLQGLLIGLAIIASVFVASAVIKNGLVKQALIKEADYFWASRQQDPTFPLPNTMNLSGLMVSEDTVGDPQSITSLPLGFHELSDDELYSNVYVTNRNGKKLILGFAADQVRQLTLYFGLLPLMAVLMVLYLSLWWAYRVSQRAISPVISLAQKVANLDPAEATPQMFAPSANNLHGDEEVSILSQALMRFTQRVNDSLERERSFTRDVSHELRSPLTVIKLAAEMLLSEQDLDLPLKKSVMRISTATQDMEELTNAFLLLAREADRGVTREKVLVNDIVNEEISRAKLLICGKPISIYNNCSTSLWVNTSDKALSIAIGNLLRNAVNYTDEGQVNVSITGRELKIADSGVGMQSPQQALAPGYNNERQRGGYGVGLLLVKRFSDRFKWDINIVSKVGVGTTVTLSFPSDPV
jgi:signal transduction histidine kinase